MTETAKHPLQLWAEELYQGDLRLQYRVLRTLFSGESPFQQIDIVESAAFGRMLFNDGVVMTSERDEFVYHEMIAHVPGFVHPGIRRALVIGGGDGGSVRELLRHPTVEQCTLVEIDPLVLEGCRKHLPGTAQTFDDARVDLRVEDGVRFVAEAPAGRYDLVLVDSTDPIGPATPLFGPEFYGNVHRVLADDGIVVSQAESPFYELEQQRSLLSILGQRFERVQLYNYTNLTYPGGLWSFAYGAKTDRCPVGDFAVERVAASGLQFRYYNPEIHRAAFCHPQFQADALKPLLTPLR